MPFSTLLLMSPSRSFLVAKVRRVYSFIPSVYVSLTLSFRDENAIYTLLVLCSAALPKNITFLGMPVMFSKPNYGAVRITIG
jgi:hypothetical protein